MIPSLNTVPSGLRLGGITVVLTCESGIATVEATNEGAGAYIVLVAECGFALDPAEIPWFCALMQEMVAAVDGGKTEIA